MYQNFISRLFSNQSGIVVLVNWPRAHCGILQLTEVSSLGQDSLRTSPRNETVKQRRRKVTVANSPVQWPSWTWCRTRWHCPCRVTLSLSNFKINAVLLSFVRALLCCIDIMSFRELRATVLFIVAPHRDESVEQHSPRVVVWQLSNFCTGRIVYGPDGRHGFTQKQSLDSGI